MTQSPDNFDWDKVNFKGFGTGYSQAEIDSFTSQYDNTLSTIAENTVVEGLVVGITDKDVILNIGFKSDGLVPLAEFRDIEELKVGDRLEVFIEDQEDKNGQLILSRRKARIVKAWEKIRAAQDNDEAIEGLVKRRTKGGLIVDIFGVESFLPGSQIDVRPIRDFDIYVGKKMEVKVVKINPTNDNVVVSHKVLIEKDLELQKSSILNNLEKGQVLEGTIKNMTSFGVFIDLGGVDGLLHITDISWGRINHPEDVLALDQKVQVVVLDFDEDKKRISLGMKQLSAHPWDMLDAAVEAGSKIAGKIVNVADYGAFLEIIPGVEGLIHVSEMSWSQHMRDPRDFLAVGQDVEAVVLNIDRAERKMSLGLKQLTEDPWTKEEVLVKYAKGSRHSGVVRNMTNFGLFLELEEGIDGLLHTSDLSWTRKIKHPSEFTKVGDSMDVIVLEIDSAGRKLSLGHKQLEENPWDTFENIFAIGSVHKGTIVAKVEKGCTVELPYGLEGFAPIKQLVKEDGSSADVGESLDFKVVEFNKEERRIVVSHTTTFKADEEKPAAAPKAAAKKGKKGADEPKGDQGNISNVAATSSLDEDGTLAALKAAMSAAEDKK